MAVLRQSGIKIQLMQKIYERFYSRRFPGLNCIESQIIETKDKISLYIIIFGAELNNDFTLEVYDGMDAIKKSHDILLEVMS